MKCQQCKNPIQPSAQNCEWCGFIINNDSNKITNYKSIILENQKKETPNQAKGDSNNKILYLVPGLGVLIIWLIGNLITERDKHAIFNMDDLSPILFGGLIFLGLGIIIRLVKK